MDFLFRHDHEGCILLVLLFKKLIQVEEQRRAILPDDLVSLAARKDVDERSRAL